MSFNKKDIQKINWIKTVARPIFLYGQISQTEGERDFLSKKIGFGIKNKILFPGKGGHTQYFGKKDWSDFASTINNRLKNEEGWLKEYAEKSYKLGEEIVSFLKRIYKTDFSKKSEKELLKHYRLFEKYRAELAYLLYPYLVIEKFLEKKLKKELKNELRQREQQDSFDSLFCLITSKTKLNESDEAENDLFELAKEFVEKGETWDEEIKRKLEKYADKYTWLPYYGYGLPVGNKEYFKEQLLQIEDPAEKLNNKRGARKKQKEMLTKTKKDFQETIIEKLIDIIQTYLHLRSYRTEVLRKSYYYPHSLLLEIAKRMGAGLEDLFFLVPEEIRDFLRKGIKPSLGKIKERRVHYAILMTDGEIEVVSKKEDIAALMEILIQEENTASLQGKGVYPGNVRGIIKIIGDIKEVSKIKKGNILVTHMTTPDMTVAIHKAGAIVTDEGGVTCHAAIVSREMKIPCIIGTQNATKVLNDGDFVEVDAQKGIVKILEKSK